MCCVSNEIEDIHICFACFVDGYCCVHYIFHTFHVVILLTRTTIICSENATKLVKDIVINYLSS